MIISASRRTDIPTYYSEWFYNRIREGYAFVRNPMNIHQIGKINLSPDVVDGIVFWTKNPTPMIDRIDELKNYNYYFQFTLNPYGKDVEPNVPSKSDIIIPVFQKLSRKIGKEKIVWRYDPILFNDKYTLKYHIKYFQALVLKLSQFTEKCTVSFIDFYRNTERNTRSLNILDPHIDLKIELIQRFSKIAEEYGIYVDTCAEEVNLEELGVKHARCIDKERLERIGGYNLLVEKDKTQRPVCGCVASIDIGAYNTCKNGCLYCYANYSSTTVQKNSCEHNPSSPLIVGEIGNDDVVRDRKVGSFRDYQTTLFN